MKAVGAVCLILGASWFGWHLASLWKQRLALLGSLRQLVYFLKGEILYSHATLAEGLSQAGRKGGGPFGELFLEAARRLEQRDGTPFSQIWQEEAGKVKNLPLAKEDWEKLEALKNQYPVVKDHRGVGLIQGLEFMRAPGEIAAAVIKKGVILITAEHNVLRFVPPLGIKEEHVDEMLRALEEVLSEQG